ncbi:MAG: ECF-type sigma factor [Phycisphaerales bacterium]
MLLAAARGGGDAGVRAASDLAAVVYAELSDLARAVLSREAAASRPETAALVNEAYMRLMRRTDVHQQTDEVRCGPASSPPPRDTTDAAPPGFDDRRHFFGAAARAMRRILIDAARARRALKRGGGHLRPLPASPECTAPVDPDLLANVESLGASPDELDDALNALQRNDQRGADVVHLRFFAGLSEETVGEVLGLSDRQVRRDWQHARAWLLAYLSKSSQPM